MASVASVVQSAMHAPGGWLAGAYPPIRRYFPFCVISNRHPAGSYNTATSPLVLPKTNTPAGLAWYVTSACAGTCEGRFSSLAIWSAHAIGDVAAPLPDWFPTRLSNDLFDVPGALSCAAAALDLATAKPATK